MSKTKDHVLIQTTHQNVFDPKDGFYCKKLHKLVKDFDNCGKCSYLTGSMQGMGVECTWDDDSIASDGEGILTVNDPRQELLRVSKLIDSKVITKG